MSKKNRKYRRHPDFEIVKNGEVKIWQECTVETMELIDSYRILRGVNETLDKYVFKGLLDDALKTILLHLESRIVSNLEETGGRAV